MPEVITWDTKLTYGCENSASVVIYICCTSAAICRITFPGRHYKYFKCFQRKQNLNFISKLQWIQILFASLWVKWWWRHGSVCLANLSKLFYTVFYMSLEGTVLFRSLWPLQVLGKVLNSWAKSKRLKKKLFGGFCFCFFKGKNIFPFLGTHSFYSFKNNSRKSTLSRKVMFVKIQSSFCYFPRLLPSDMKGENSHSWSWEAEPARLVLDLHPPPQWRAAAPSLCWLHVPLCSLEVISRPNIQACKPESHTWARNNLWYPASPDMY